MFWSPPQARRASRLNRFGELTHLTWHPNSHIVCNSFYLALLATQLDGAPPRTHPHWNHVALPASVIVHCAAALVSYARAWAAAGDASLAQGARALLLDAQRELARAGEAVAPHAAQLDALVAGLAPLVRLQLRKLAVVPLPDLKPLLFLTGSGGFSVSRDHDPDVARRTERALRKKLKDERRGAVRELKRDRAYLNSLKAQELEEETAERKGSLKKIMGFLQDQQAEANLEAKLKQRSIKM